MILYLSGPMSGIPEDNFPKFFEEERRLREAGYTVINPARGSVPTSFGRYGAGWWSNPEYKEVLGRQLSKIDDCEGLALIDGWPGSNGAKAERRRAWLQGKPIGTADEWVEWGTARAIKWVGDPACTPVRGYDGDAGYDLVVSHDTRIAYRAFEDVPMGVCAEMPPGYWGLLVGRSSTVRKRGLSVTLGIIDNGYRGPLFAGCLNVSDKAVELKRGERIAQLIPVRLESSCIGLQRVAELSGSARGAMAFGSSGGFHDGSGAPK